MTYILNGNVIPLPTSKNIFKDIFKDIFEKKYPNFCKYNKKQSTYDKALVIIEKHTKAKFTIGIANSFGCKTIFSDNCITITADCNKKGEYYRIYFMI